MMTCNQVYEFSDVRFKTEIEELDEHDLSQLKPVKYKWKNLPDSGIIYGFLAQDILKIFPNMVKEDGSGILSLDYNQFIPLLIKKVQTQEVRIKELENNINIIFEHFGI